MSSKCKICSKKTLKPGHPLCLSCWQKKGKSEEILMPRKQKIVPTKEQYVSQKMVSTQWGRMGYWARAGKGGAYIDTSPGGSISGLQLWIGFAGFLLLISDEAFGLVLILVAFLIQIPRYFARKRYLERNYEEKYGELSAESEKRSGYLEASVNPSDENIKNYS